MKKIEILEKILTKYLQGKMRFMHGEPHYSLSEDGVSYEGDIFSSIHKKEFPWKPGDESDYLPLPLYRINHENVFTLQDDYVVIFEQHLSPDVFLEIVVYKGSISGVGYTDGYQVSVAVNYFGNLLQFYSYKESKDTFDGVLRFGLSGFYDDDLFNLIDFKDFKKVPYRHRQFYLESYSSCLLNDDECDTSKLFKLLVDDKKTMIIYNTFTDFNVHYRDEDIHDKDFFIKLGVEKIILETSSIGRFKFNLPKNFKIEFDFKKDKNPNSYCKQTFKQAVNNVLDTYSHLSPYFPNEYQSKASKVKFLQGEWKLYNTILTVEFNYKNLHGYILTNEYRLKIMENHYREQGVFDLDIAGLKITLTQEEFFNSIKVRRKGITKAVSSTLDNFGGRIGYMGWWLDSFDKTPERIR